VAKLRVVVADDELLYLDLLRLALSGHDGIEVVGTFPDGAKLLENVEQVKPDVAVLDVAFPQEPNGIEVGRELKKRMPGLGIVLLSNHVNPAFVASLRRSRTPGWAYLDKKSVGDVDTLIRAIRGVVEGQVVLDPGILKRAEPRAGTAVAALTERQREILELIAQGFSNNAIAEALWLSPKTVENHINVLYQELGLRREAAYMPRVMAVLMYLDQTRFIEG